jgi:hypothetical protein
MSFQWIFNTAESLSINRLAVVASTQSRNGIVKAINRGTPKKTFTVQLPDGPRWTDLKTDIAAAEALDKHTTASITIAYSRFPWYYGNVDPGGSAETYTVICTQFPQWTIFAQNQVSWDGPFVFVEV